MSYEYCLFCCDVSLNIDSKCCWDIAFWIGMSNVLSWGVIILSVSIVKPKSCRESSTAAMWLVVLCFVEFVGFLRGQPGVARRSAKFWRRALVSLPTRVSSSFSLMKPASPIWIASHMTQSK